MESVNIGMETSFYVFIVFICCLIICGIYLVVRGDLKWWWFTASMILAGVIALNMKIEMIKKENYPSKAILFYYSPNIESMRQRQVWNKFLSKYNDWDNNIHLKSLDTTNSRYKDDLDRFNITKTPTIVTTINTELQRKFVGFISFEKLENIYTNFVNSSI